MGKRLDRLKEEIGRAHVIEPSAAAIYRVMVTYARRMAEQLAPEVFKWIGWAVAIAAIRIVAINVDRPWLSGVPYLLLWVVMLRIGWFLGPVELKESDAPDGSIHMERITWRFLLRALIAGLITWGLAYAIVFELADAIASSELVEKVMPAKR